MHLNLFEYLKTVFGIKKISIFVFRGVREHDASVGVFGVSASVLPC